MRAKGVRCRDSTRTLWPCSVVGDCVEDAVGETLASLPAPHCLKNSSAQHALFEERISKVMRQPSRWTMDHFVKEFIEYDSLVWSLRSTNASTNFLSLCQCSHLTASLRVNRRSDRRLAKPIIVFEKSCRLPENVTADVPWPANLGFDTFRDSLSLYTVFVAQTTGNLQDAMIPSFMANRWFIIVWLMYFVFAVCVIAQVIFSVV